MEKQPYENLRGDKNPMHRPEVAAKQSASLRKTLKKPEVRLRLSQKALDRWAKPGAREKMSQKMREVYGTAGLPPKQSRPSKKWTVEDKLRQSDRMKAYWAKVKAALDLMDNQQHADQSAT